MAKQTKAGKIYIGLCKCCLSDGSYVDMWAEYFYNGEREIYGDMLAECFGHLLKENSSDVVGVELICDGCVKRLRDAYHFRNLVLASANTMEDCFKKPASEDSQSQMTILSVERLEDDLNIKIEEEDYEEVEYLEEVPDLEEHLAEEKVGVKEEPKAADSDATTTYEKRRWPKRKRRGNVSRTHRNYSPEDFQRALAEVRAGRLTGARAARKYHIPKSSITGHIARERRAKEKRAAEVDLEPDEAKKAAARERSERFLSETRALLSVCSARVFRTRATRLQCAYCRAPPFLYAADFRAHMLAAHHHERVTNVELALKPFWFFEVVKIDIEGLRCTACDTAIARWADLLEHLTDEHGMQFTEIQNKLIPFVLDEANRCALCDTKFKNYHLLDAHMNSHYGNYVCNSCGDTFMTMARLTKHVESHSPGCFPCSVCGKIYQYEKYMRKHIRTTHADQPTAKCIYCDAKFRATYERHRHVLQEHPDKVKYITCELCGKRFDWSPYYFAHMRRQHRRAERLPCPECRAAFDTKAQLKRHMNVHRGETYKCDACNKTFVSKYTLKAHLRLRHAQ